MWSQRSGVETAGMHDFEQAGWTWPRQNFVSDGFKATQHFRTTKFLSWTV